MWNEPTYKDFEDLKSKLIGHRVTRWDEDSLTLDDGTVVEIVMSESDCCAFAGGKFKDVELDAAITDVVLEDKGSDSLDYETTSYANVILYHNQNRVALAECYADDGNAGYYYSVCSLRVKDVDYEVVSQ